MKYKTDFPVIINLPQRFTATISVKVHRDVFSAVSHDIRIAGARGHVRSFAMNMTLFSDHIFPYGDFKKNSVASWRLLKKVNCGPWVLVGNDTPISDSAVADNPSQPTAVPASSGAQVAEPSQTRVRPRREIREPAWLKDYVRTVVY